MILRRIALARWRCFEEETIIDFRPGLNVIHGSNESGKSTILEALSRAFYEKHKAGGAEIEAIRPLGRAVTPHVAVDFEEKDATYRIERRYLKAVTELHRLEHGSWRILAEGEEADRQVRLLAQGGERGGANKMPVEARGLAQALWLLQRDPSDLPKDWAPQVRQGLGGILEAVAETAEAGRFSTALEKQYLEWFTPNGAEKKGGELSSAREAEKQVEMELETLRQRERKVQDLRNRLDRLEDEARLLTHDAERHASEVEKALEAAKGADVHERAYAEALRNREEAKRASEELSKTLTGIRERQEKAKWLCEELTNAERELRHAESDSKSQEAARDEAQIEAIRLKKGEALLRGRLEALEAAIQCRSKLHRIGELERTLSDIETLRTRVGEAQTRLTTLGAPNAKSKERFELADRELSSSLAARQASGIVVRFALKEGANLVTTNPPVFPDEEGRYFLTRQTTFEFEELGSMTVGGGGEAITTLDAKIERLTMQRAAVLGELSVEEFLRRYLLGEEIRGEIQNASASLEALERNHPHIAGELTRLRCGIL